MLQTDRSKLSLRDRLVSLWPTKSRNQEAQSPVQLKEQNLPRYPNRRWTIFSFISFFLALGLHRWVGNRPELIEKYYSRQIYPRVATLLNDVSQYTGFSLAELLVGIVIIVGLILLFRGARTFYRATGRRHVLLISAGIKLIGWAGVGLLIFLCLWGFNYGRQPLAINLSIDRRALDINELEFVTRMMITETNNNYQDAREYNSKPLSTKRWGGINSASVLTMSHAELNQFIENSYRTKKLPGDSIKVIGMPKPVYFSPFMTRMGITGIYMPFTGEANYNNDQPACELPYTIAHEKAHQRGYALEDEANFLAFLVCIHADHPYVRYSGYMMATIQLLNQLEAVAPERYNSVASQLTSGPQADLTAMYNFWSQYQGTLMEISQKVNNSYLKANHVDSGVQNYDQVVDLIVGYYYTPTEVEDRDRASSTP